MIQLLCAFALLAGAVAPRPAELALERALPVGGLPGAEPSGLAIRNGELYTVSDDHDRFIYRLNIEQDAALMEAAIPVAMPEPGRGDFEGIVAGDTNDFYLISESKFRILHVSADGKDCAWITPNLRSAGEEAGLFRFRGGYIEGLTRVDAKHFIVCAERQPRGLMYITVSGGPPGIEGFVLNHPTIQPRGLRFPDFTDLFWFGGAAYVLERNAEIISTIKREGREISVTAWRSFRETLERKDYRYADRRFGMAEGLAMDERRIYIIVDNNGNARESDPNDTRAMLFIFTKPPH